MGRMLKALQQIETQPLQARQTVRPLSPEEIESFGLWRSPGLETREDAQADQAAPDAEAPESAAPLEADAQVQSAEADEAAQSSEPDDEHTDRTYRTSEVTNKKRAADSRPSLPSLCFLF